MWQLYLYHLAQHTPKFTPCWAVKRFALTGVSWGATPLALGDAGAPMGALRAVRLAHRRRRLSLGFISRLTRSGDALRSIGAQGRTCKAARWLPWNATVTWTGATPARPISPRTTVRKSWRWWRRRRSRRRGARRRWCRTTFWGTCSWGRVSSRCTSIAVRRPRSRLLVVVLCLPSIAFWRRDLSRRARRGPCCSTLPCTWGTLPPPLEGLGRPQRIFWVSTIKLN